MLLAFLIAASLPVAAAPQDPIEADAKPATLSAMEQYEAVKAEYDKSMQAFWKELQELPQDEQGAFYEKRPSADEFAAKFIELAQAHPKTEAAASSYLWVAQYSEETDRASAALDALIVDHVDSPNMAQACSLLMRKYDVGEKYLKEILEASSSTKVQGYACYYLGKHYMSLTDMAGTLSKANAHQRQAYVGYLGGEDVVARIAAMDPAELQSEAEEYLERVCGDYADVEGRRGKLSKSAERDLYQIRNLQIGLVAPEIEGEDIFGAGFKLSDYRGKVVVIDFWGHW